MRVLPTPRSRPLPSRGGPLPLARKAGEEPTRAQPVRSWSRGTHAAPVWTRPRPAPPPCFTRRSRRTRRTRRYDRCWRSRTHGRRSRSSRETAASAAARRWRKGGLPAPATAFPGSAARLDPGDAPDLTRFVNRRGLALRRTEEWANDYGMGKGAGVRGDRIHHPRRRLVQRSLFQSGRGRGVPSGASRLAGRLIRGRLAELRPRRRIPDRSHAAKKRRRR